MKAIISFVVYVGCLRPLHQFTRSPRPRAESAWPESSIDNMHDSEHFLLPPRLTNNLHAHRKSLHRLHIIRTLRPIKVSLEDFRSVSRCGAPLLREPVARGIDAGDWNDANRRVHDVVHQSRACDRCKAIAPAMWQRWDRLNGSDHRVESKILWLGSIPERRARLPLERNLVRNAVVILEHGFMMRACEE